MIPESPILVQANIPIKPSGTSNNSLLDSHGEATDEQMI